MGDSQFTTHFLGKLKAIGNTIGDAAVNVGGTVVGAGTKVVGVVKDIPNSIGHNSDFDHIKSINQLARQKPVQKQHHYTDAEWAEAERRADAVLDKLFPGYFEADFDPVKHELEQLTVEAGPEEIDGIVDKLTLGVEVRLRRRSSASSMRPMHAHRTTLVASQKATGKLSRRVFTKRDQLLQGMSTVATIGDDLKAAFLITR